MHTEVIVQADRPTYRGLSLIGWGLLGFTCLLALMPLLGCVTWAIAGPVLLSTFILAIVIMSRGGTLQGILLMVVTIFVAPLWIFFAPFLGTLIGFGGLAAADNASQRSARSSPPVVTTPTIPLARSSIPAAPQTSRTSQARPTEPDTAVAVSKVDPGYIEGPMIDVPADSFTDFIERQPPGLPMWDKHYLNVESVSADVEMEIFYYKTDPNPIDKVVLSKSRVDRNDSINSKPGYYFRLRSLGKDNSGNKIPAKVKYSWAMIADYRPPKPTTSTSSPIR